MPKLKIDASDLMTALSDHASEWVLDVMSGQVLMAEWIRDPHLGVDFDPPLDDSDEEPLESDRFLHIQPVESHESFRWMEDFAESQSEDRVRERLLDALDRPRPFRHFKDALNGLAPEIREAWFRYEDERLREAAAAWLSLEGIDAELVDARHAPGPT